MTTTTYPKVAELAKRGRFQVSLTTVTPGGREQFCIVYAGSDRAFARSLFNSLRNAGQRCHDGDQGVYSVRLYDLEREFELGSWEWSWNPTVR